MRAFLVHWWLLRVEGTYQGDFRGRVVIMSVGGEGAAVHAGGGGGEETEVGLEGEDGGVGASVASSEPRCRRALLLVYQLHHFRLSSYSHRNSERE